MKNLFIKPYHKNLNMNLDEIDASAKMIEENLKRMESDGIEHQSIGAIRNWLNDINDSLSRTRTLLETK